MFKLFKQCYMSKWKGSILKTSFLYFHYVFFPEIPSTHIFSSLYGEMFFCFRLLNFPEFSAAEGGFQVFSDQFFSIFIFLSYFLILLGLKSRNSEHHCCTKQFFNEIIYFLQLNR